MLDWGPREVYEKDDEYMAYGTHGVYHVYQSEDDDDDDDTKYTILDKWCCTFMHNDSTDAELIYSGAESSYVAHQFCERHDYELTTGKTIVSIINATLKELK